MKIIYLSILVILGFVNQLNAQCSCSATDYAVIDVNCWLPGQSANITTCQYGGERATISNTVAGAVYRISTCGSGYDTQLSIYTTGCASIAYNDDGGPGCGGTSASVDFTSPGGNLYSVMNQYNCASNTTCTTVSIQLISLPDYTPATSFGSNVWNVYGYLHTGYNFANQMNLSGVHYRGFYTDGNLNINSVSRWGTSDSPSFASGWSGCSVTSDNHLVVYKRQGFPCGQYEINLTNHDDGVRCYVNGVQVYQIDACCANRGVIFRGLLDANSTVEFRVSEGGGGSNLFVDFNLVNTVTASVSYEKAAGCNLSNILVSNPAGGACTWINTDFSASLANTQLNGAAAYTGGGCRLTPNSGGQLGSFTVDNPSAFNPVGINLNYNFFIGNGGGADGMSISYGNIPMSSNGGEFGSGSELIIKMVTYSGAGPRVDLIYNNVVISSYSGFPWRNAQRASSMTINDGYLTYVIDGTTVFNNVDLGVAYRSANKSGWRWAFAARTGGVSDDHYIYNLQITAREYEYSIGAGWQSSTSFNNLTGGNTYNIQVRPKCSSACATTVSTIALPNYIPTLSATAIAPTCYNGTNGSIDLSVSGSIHGARVVKIVQLANEPFNTNEIQAIQAGTGTNVALTSNGGIADQSSSLNPVSYPASWLNDGNVHNGVGAHTNTGVGQWQKVYWNVPASLESIIIWNRDDCCDYRLNNIRIEIYGDLAETNLLFSQVVNANNGVGTSYTFNPVNQLSNPSNAYTWNTGATTEDLVGVGAGTYNVSMTDDYGCVASLAGLVIPNPTQLTLSTSVTNTSCLTSTDGSIDLTVNNASNKALPPSFGSLAIWTKADAGVVKNKDGEVIQWQDLSGNDNHFYTTYGDNVQEVAGAIGGQPALRFDANNIMESNNVVTGNFTVIVVAKMNGASNQRLISSGSNNWLFGWWGGRMDQFYSEGWVSNPATSANTSAYIYTGTGNIAGDAYSIYNNGSLVVTNNGGSQAPGVISLGGWGANNTERSAGDVAEIIAYNRVLGTDERRALEYYLSQKYSIAGPTPVAPTYSWSNGASTEDVSGLGTGSYTVNVTDASGCTANATGTVNNGDVTPPSITCPANISVNSDPGLCGAVVTYSTPSASDNCIVSSVNRTAGLASGSTFPIGTTTVTYRATDNTGLTSDCSFTVTVTDNQVPTALCKNISKELDATGTAIVFAVDVDNGSFDNCSVAGLGSSPAVFNCSNLGPNTVTLTVNDGYGNSNTCTSTVTITQASSTAPTSISASSSFVCNGSSVTLNQVGGSLGIGASYKWYSGSCGASLVGSGASISVTPSVTTTYFLRTESVCGDILSSCVSYTVIINGSSSAPAASVVLASSSSSSTCLVNDNNWHYFYNSSGELLAAVNSNNQNLGSVTVSITVGDNGPFGQGLNPGICGSSGTSSGEYVMPRYWDISVTNQPSSVVDVVFYYENADVASLVATLNGVNSNYLACWGDVNVEADLMMTVTHTSGGTELFPTLSYANGPNVGAGQRQIAFQLSQFSGGKLHSNGGLYSGNALPVELVQFNAIAIDNKFVQLKWTTATEINNEGFDIERSLDGFNFEKIAWIAGNGNSSSLIDYYFDDYGVAAGMYYYRLKQVDFDGQFEYSELRSAKLTQQDQFELSEFIPNPTADKTILQISSSKDRAISIQIFDVQGQVVFSKELILEPGYQDLSFDTEFLSSGAYIATIRTESNFYNRKLIVSK